MVNGSEGDPSLDIDDLCGFGLKEYSKLKQAIDSYQQTASNS